MHIEPTAYAIARDKASFPALHLETVAISTCTLPSHAETTNGCARENGDLSKASVTEKGGAFARALSTITLQAPASAAHCLLNPDNSSVVYEISSHNFHAFDELSPRTYFLLPLNATKSSIPDAEPSTRFCGCLFNGSPIICFIFF